MMDYVANDEYIPGKEKSEARNASSVTGTPDDIAAAPGGLVGGPNGVEITISERLFEYY